MPSSRSAVLLRCLILLLCLVPSAAQADMLVTHFTISSPFTTAPPGGAGTLTLSLNPDGTIGGHLVSDVPGQHIAWFGFNVAGSVPLPLAISGLPLGYSTFTGSGSILGSMDHGFLYQYNTYGESLWLPELWFQVAAPGGFTSVWQMVELSDLAACGGASPACGPAVDFTLNTYNNGLPGNVHYFTGAIAEPVPEPASVALVAMGVAALRRRRKE